MLLTTKTKRLTSSKTLIRNDNPSFCFCVWMKTEDAEILNNFNLFTSEQSKGWAKEVQRTNEKVEAREY